MQDILVALNIVELPTRQFGLEAAGIVTNVGPSVKDLKIGDRVVCLKKSAFARYFCVPEFACAKIPSEIRLDEVSSMLVPYVTAIHSLVNVGRLAKGQVCILNVHVVISGDTHLVIVRSYSQCLRRRWSGGRPSRSDA